MALSCTRMNKFAAAGELPLGATANKDSRPISGGGSADSVLGRGVYEGPTSAMPIGKVSGVECVLVLGFLVNSETRFCSR